MGGDKAKDRGVGEQASALPGRHSHSAADDRSRFYDRRPLSSILFVSRIRRLARTNGYTIEI